MVRVWQLLGLMQGLSQQQGWNFVGREGVGAACRVLDGRQERPGTATGHLVPSMV